MPYDRFLIGFNDPNSTLQTDVKPWLIADNAFTQLNNAYVFRGRVRKRFGSRFMGTGWSSSQTEPLFSRLRVQVGTVASPSANVPGSVFKIGQMFSVGDEIFTVYQNGTPAAMLSTGVGTGTYDTSNGNFTISGTGLVGTTPIWFYPAEPVMGIAIYQKGSINDQPTYAFDTQFAYVFSGGFWQRLIISSASTPASTTSPIWHDPNGDTLNFFWTSNWDGVSSDQVTMFITNFQASIGAASATDDAIWAVSTAIGWTPLSYAYGTTNNPNNTQPLTVTRTSQTTAGGTITNYVQSCRLVISFKNRLLLLNTIENNGNGATQYNTTNRASTGVTPANYLTSTNTAFVNRCRYSHNGSPFAQNAWLEPNQVYYPDANAASTFVVADGGGYIDATTEEAIISAEFIKDRLIVYFERSTWEIVYTFNDALPFVWQKINTELGSESQQSTVPFDQQVLTIGNTGVHACNGANVQRIDNKIPQQVFEILDKNTGVQRVAGIRDYYVEMVYWTFPSDTQPTAQIYPSKVLVYNYKTGSWALNDDCFTAFGYFEQQSGMTWSSQTLTWEEANFTWGSGSTSANFRQVIAGNPEGYVVIIDPDASNNARAWQVTNLVINSPNLVTLTIIDHTLRPTTAAVNVGTWIALHDLSGITFDDSITYQIVQTNDTFPQTITIGVPAGYAMSGTYLGGGTAERVPNIQLQGKQWNPYNTASQPGGNFALGKIDFSVLRTAQGEITVDYYPSSTPVSMLADSVPDAIMGSGVLETFPYDPAIYPLEQYQEFLWHSIYFQTFGDSIQLNITMSDSQMQNYAIAVSNFELEGMVLYTQKAGRIM